MTISGQETAHLLDRGAEYIEWMGRYTAFDYLSVGPTADVPINPSNPMKLQLSLSPNSEQTQILDLERIAEIVGGTELAAQLQRPVTELDVPMLAVDEGGRLIDSSSHSMGLFEAVFTTTDGIDVSLASIAGSIITKDRRHHNPEVVAHIKDFAKFVGSTALQYNRVNILVDHPPETNCHAFAVCKSKDELVDIAAGSLIVGDWNLIEDNDGTRGIKKRSVLGNPNWQVSIYPEEAENLRPRSF